MSDYQVLLYGFDGGEIASLYPILRELVSRGISAHISNNLSESAEVGLYACTPNRMYDFANHLPIQPRNRVSYFQFHDLYQDNGLGARYFLDQPLRMFDYGLVPGPQHSAMLAEAQREPSVDLVPKNGWIEVGWPKSDRYFASKFQDTNVSIASHRETTSKPVALLAASWQTKEVIEAVLKSGITVDWTVLVKFAPLHLSYPDPVSPWFDTLEKWKRERQFAFDLASRSSQLNTLDPESDLFECIAAADVVISNGSSVSLEANLIGKPALNVISWGHPSGPEGKDLETPNLSGSGIIRCEETELQQVLSRLKSQNFAIDTKSDSEPMITTSTQGIAAKLTVDLIEKSLNGESPL